MTFAVHATLPEAGGPVVITWSAGELSADTDAAGVVLAVATAMVLDASSVALTPTGPWARADLDRPHVAAATLCEALATLGAAGVRVLGDLGDPPAGLEVPPDAVA